jgi:undecaprenyl-diphosphatase
MEQATLIQALILGVVEGLTEFLPVSSTAHLIIAGDLLGFSGETGKTFEVVIQLGAIMGVVWTCRARILDVVVHARRSPQRRLLLNLLLAFLPAGLLGLACHRYIKQHLFNPLTVAVPLMVGGLAILFIEGWYKRQRSHVESLADLKPGQALAVGLAQTLALVPGVSRAAATIMGGLLTGLSRTPATEFSFLLAIPTMLSAALFDLYSNWQVLRSTDAAAFGVGLVSAFVTALLVVRTLMVYVSRHTFRPFGWYRLALGAVVALYFW